MIHDLWIFLYAFVAQMQSLSVSKSTCASWFNAIVNYTAIKRICDIYDWDGKGELDMVFFGDVIYALGLNITKKICKGLGEPNIITYICQCCRFC